MKIKPIQLSLWAMLAVLLLASCTRIPKYVKVIPADATVVMRIDVEQLAEKSGFGDDSKTKQKLTEALKEADLSREAREKAEAILDDPAQPPQQPDQRIIHFFLRSFACYIALFQICRLHVFQIITGLCNRGHHGDVFSLRGAFVPCAFARLIKIDRLQQGIPLFTLQRPAAYARQYKIAEQKHKKQH